MSQPANTFTFTDGITIDTVGLILNPQQRHALQRIADFLANPLAPCFTLEGYAGTGKSTIMRFVLAYLKELGIQRKQWREVVLTAPTHRAKSILTAMAGKETATVHSLLALRPDFDIEQLDLRRLEYARSKEKECQIPSRGVLIVDESSMLNDGLLAVLQQECKARRCQILFVGDRAQIKPVKQDHVSRVFDLPRVELTHVERQRGGNPLGPVLDVIRNNRQASADAFTRATAQNEAGEGIIFSNVSEQVLAWITEQFTSTNFASDPNHVRVLAGSNERVREYNARIRQVLHGRGADEYQVGEILMGYDNYGSDSLGGVAITNSADYVVRKANPGTRIVGDQKTRTEGWVLTLAEPGSSITCDIYVLRRDTDDATIRALFDEMEYLRQQARAAQAWEKAAKWKAFFAFREAFALPRDYEQQGRQLFRKTLDYGYAHTVHKSQGGSYRFVFVDEEDIDRFFWQDHELRNQMKYVAFSRARVGVLSYSRKPIQESVAA